MGKELRTEVVKFRVSPSEKQRILEYAALSNTHESDYARSVCLAGYRVKHGTEVSREMNVSETRVEIIREDAQSSKQRRESSG